MMTEVLKQILDLIKSDQSIQHNTGLLALRGWIEENKDITTLEICRYYLGEHSVEACEHLSKLRNLTTLDLSQNNLGEHLVGVCQAFLIPITPITLNFSNDGLSEEDIQTQCRQIVQENLYLRKKDIGVVWLNSLFRKKEKEESLKKDVTCKENQDEELMGQQSSCKQLVASFSVKLFDIPNPLIKNVLDYARPAATLEIRY